MQLKPCGAHASNKWFKEMKRNGNFEKVGAIKKEALLGKGGKWM